MQMAQHLNKSYDNMERLKDFSTIARSDRAVSD